MLPSGLVYRTIGGVLDMYFFLGPTPEEVSQQYMQVKDSRVIPKVFTFFLKFH